MALRLSCTHVKDSIQVVLIVATAIVMAGYVTADTGKDREECAEQLAGLATCLPYVQGEAKAPTPDCCSGLKQVMKTSKKCLCVIVKDGNDPQLGLNINATLALGLPSVCHAPANVSQCPALLNLDPNSPEAQVFYHFANSSGHTTTAPSPAPAVGPTGASYEGIGSPANARASASDGLGIMKKLLVVALSLVVLSC